MKNKLILKKNQKEAYFHVHHMVISTDKIMGDFNFLFYGFLNMLKII